jgi:hypothetical protein
MAEAASCPEWHEALAENAAAPGESRQSAITVGLSSIRD